MKPKNPALRNRKYLTPANYVRKACPESDYWFGIEETQIKKLVAKHGNHFFIVIAGAEDDVTDFFVIPFTQVKPLLTTKAASVYGGKRRWYAKIRHGQLVINNQTKNKLDVEKGDVIGLTAAMLSIDKSRRLIAKLVAAPPVGLFEHWEH